MGPFLTGRGNPEDSVPNLMSLAISAGGRPPGGAIVAGGEARLGGPDRHYRRQYGLIFDVVQRIRCLIEVGLVFPVSRLLLIMLNAPSMQTDTEDWEITLRNALHLPMNEDKVIAATLIHQLQTGPRQCPIPNKIP